MFDSIIPDKGRKLLTSETGPVIRDNDLREARVWQRPIVTCRSWLAK